MGLLSDFCDFVIKNIFSPPTVGGRKQQYCRLLYESGYGDYTKEKYQQPDMTVEEIDAILKNRKG